MKSTGLKRVLSILVALVLSLQTLAPAVAFAGERAVQVDNHTTPGEQAQTVSDLKIDDVEKPKPGERLDGRARVTSAESASWEIPVLWVRDDLSVVTMAEEGRTYLPALVFFVPQEYAVEAGTFTVTLSDSLAELFGTNEVVSVFDEATGITYILPASLRDLFVRARVEAAADATDAYATQSEAAEQQPSE
ncbi:MAG: hypothetical protein Q4A01_11705 [Coriobacteriales bacterium]|nr:hypothetical protein [Coriobacteriales bacterium]